MCTNPDYVVCCESVSGKRRILDLHQGVKWIILWTPLKSILMRRSFASKVQSTAVPSGTTIVWGSFHRTVPSENFPLEHNKLSYDVMEFTTSLRCWKVMSFLRLTRSCMCAVARLVELW